MVTDTRTDAWKVIAADTSSLRRYWSGVRDHDTDIVERAFVMGDLVIAPVVISEILSDSAGGNRFLDNLASVPTLPIVQGHFERAGLLRAKLIQEGFKPSVEKCLIAQACIDNNVPLVAHDRDFRHFIKAGLKLL